MYKYLDTLDELLSKNGFYSYIETKKYYKVIIDDDDIDWVYKIYKDNQSEVDTFNNTILPVIQSQNYTKSNIDGKPKQQADSRPSHYTVVFTQAFDDTFTNVSYPIGVGTKLEWDWSKDTTVTDVYTNQVPIPEGYKRLRIRGSFCENTRLKDGAIYYHNIPKKGYCNFYIACPPNYPYKDSNGDIQIATEYTVIEHFVIQKGLYGSVLLGDELNSETSTEYDIPPYYEWWFEIDTPDTDNESFGWIELEIYRRRSCIL